MRTLFLLALAPLAWASDSEPAENLVGTGSKTAAHLGRSELSNQIALGRMRFDLAISNLADERYFVASGNAFAVYPGEPRQASFRVTYGF